MTSNKQYIDLSFSGQSYIDQKSIQFYDAIFTHEDMNYLVIHKDIINIKIIRFRNCKFITQALLQLKKGDWRNLLEVHISECLSLKIDKITWMYAPNLQSINYSCNQIGSESVKALTETDWPNIKFVDFRNNKIGDDGCTYLTIPSWNLKFINLRNNKIEVYGVKSILQSKWCNLTQLDLSYNYIGDTGCKYLSHSQWRFLERLQIQNIGMTKSGCRWLSKADWKSLNYIQIGRNYITLEGYQYLSNCHWSKLKIFKMTVYKQDIMEDQRILYLMKRNWKLTSFPLQNYQDYQDYKIGFQNQKHVRQIYSKSFPNAKFRQ